MSATPSKMIPLGFSAPDFNLKDTVTGNMVTLQDVNSKKATVFMFICNHCPFVKHVNSQLVKFANDYIPNGISFVAISSNDVENYPQDSPDQMKITAESLGYPFPYLYDETQAIAKAYDAVCTPDFFIFDKDLKCVYRGQLDDSRPGNGKPVTGNDIRKALDTLLAGGEVSKNQIPSIGCNIKWK